MKMKLNEFFNPQLNEIAVDPMAAAFKPAPMAKAGPAAGALPGEEADPLAGEPTMTQDTASLDQEDIKFFEAAAGRISKVKSDALVGFDVGQLTSFAAALDIWAYQLYLQISDPNVRQDFIGKATDQANSWEKSMNEVIDGFAELPKA